MMNVNLEQPSTEAILQRIDAIMRELEMLRNVVLSRTNIPDNEDLGELLFGALGQGTWAEYDTDLDWMRFVE